MILIQLFLIQNETKCSALQKNDLISQPYPGSMDNIPHNKVFKLDLGEKKYDLDFGDIALPGGKWVQRKLPEQVHVSEEIAEALEHIYKDANEHYAHQKTKEPTKNNTRRLLHYKSNRQVWIRRQKAGT